MRFVLSSSSLLAFESNPRQHESMAELTKPNASRTKLCFSGKNKSVLPDEEWSFHLVPRSLREACLIYECCREGSRSTPTADKSQWTPWLKVSKATQKYQAKSLKDAPVQSVREANYLLALQPFLPPSTVENWLVKPMYQATTLTLFQIDWLASDSQLKSDFAEWLAEQRTVKSSIAYKHRGARRKPGRTKDVNEQLVDLAIFRARNAGFTAKETAQLLQPLVNGLDPHLNKTITPQAVTDACKRVKNLIESLGF